MAEARRVLAKAPGWREAVRGDLQMHTTWSDGSLPVAEMAEHAAAMGHGYAAVTDHSKGLPIARGMDEATLLREVEEIDRVNRELAASGRSFRLLRSIEMNLSPDGRGDMDPNVLRSLDLVLGAFHSKLRETDDQTERYLAAVRNPDIHVLAHPRGRRWNARKGLFADWPRVFRAAAESGVAMEIDAFPDRQDLQVKLLEMARETAVWISIGTDAHHPTELAHIELGLAAAAQAGIAPNRIVNFLSLEDLVAWALDRTQRAEGRFRLSAEGGTSSSVSEGSPEASMDRGSDKANPRMDQELKRETEPLERGAPVPSRVEASREQEGAGEDQPQPDSRLSGDRGMTPEGALSPDELEARTDLARHLEPSIFPADRDALLASARDAGAPSTILSRLEQLPAGRGYRTVQEVWEAMGGPVEERG